MTGRADRWIRWTTIGCVALLALIAGTVSYLHMHALVAMDGQPGWVAALTPLSVDGMIVAASTTLLADSRSGRQGGSLSWLLLATGSVASLAANVAVAEPTVTGRAIAAWPSFALIGSYELLVSASAQCRRPAFHVAVTGWSFPGLAEQFADARDDLTAVQLDVGHELVVRQARHAVLQVEPGGTQGAEVRGDLLRDGFG